MQINGLCRSHLQCHNAMEAREISPRGAQRDIYVPITHNFASFLYQFYIRVIASELFLARNLEDRFMTYLLYCNFLILSCLDIGMRLILGRVSLQIPQVALLKVECKRKNSVFARLSSLYSLHLVYFHKNHHISSLNGSFTKFSLSKYFSQAFYFSQKRAGVNRNISQAIMHFWAMFLALAETTFFLFFYFFIFYYEDYAWNCALKPQS